jgi:hypothetical protein
MINNSIIDLYKSLNGRIINLDLAEEVYKELKSMNEDERLQFASIVFLISSESVALYKRLMEQRQ